MENKKSFKPPAKKNETQTRGMSLTDQQYDEIFSAVLEPQQQSSQPKTVAKSPTCASSPGLKAALSPKESASVETSQNAPNSQTETRPVVPLPVQEINTDSTIRTYNSEDFAKNANFSTPTKVTSEVQTFREALKNLRNKVNKSLSESLNESVDQSLLEIWDQPKLSQPPEGLTKRERLQWLQDRRGTGLYVKCDLSKCGKWRWLDIPDPVDVPKIWTCNLNSDERYNSCEIPEKPIPLEYEEDMIHNKYTAGSVVWAKMPSYPWWPAMVDDCPDVEQYYWLDNLLDEEPSSYHVVFFDEGEVSRLWVREENLLSFKHRPDFDRAFKIKPNQKKRFTIAKEKAKEALKLNIKQRLQRFSFLALWKKDIPEDSDSQESDSEIPKNSQDLQRYINRKIYKRRKALASSSSQRVTQKSQSTTAISKKEKVNLAASSSSKRVPQRSQSTTAISKSINKENVNLNKSLPVTVSETIKDEHNSSVSSETSSLVDGTANKRKNTKKSKDSETNLNRRQSLRLSSGDSSSSLSSNAKIEKLSISFSENSDSEECLTPKKRKNTKTSSKKPKKITAPVRKSPRLSPESKNGDKLRRLSTKSKDSIESQPKTDKKSTETEPKDKKIQKKRPSTEISEENQTEKSQKVENKISATPKSKDNILSQQTPDKTIKKLKMAKSAIKAKKPFVSPMMPGVTMLNTSSSSFASSTLGTIFEESEN